MSAPIGARVALATLALSAFVVVALVGPAVVAPPQLALAHDLDAHHGVLGAGEGGVDVAAALVYGARASFVVAGLATVFSLALATALALAAGLARGRLERAVLRVVDVVLAVPGLLLALVWAALLPKTALATVFALAVTSWAGPTRVLTAVVASLGTREHVSAARALGASPLRVAAVHVLPLLWRTLAVQATQAFAGALVADASLAFLGLGPPPLTPPFYASWGQLLDDGLAYAWAAPHLWAPPALCLVVVVVAVAVVADALAERG